MEETTPYIILADDNADDRSFIKDSFDYMQAEIKLKLVDSGKELIQRLDNTEDDSLPSLIVLDYNMPQMNGAEVLQILSANQRYAKIPRIILSTSLYQKHIDYCMRMGANGYLIKPDNMFEWKEVARKMLDYVQKPNLKKTLPKP